MHSRGLGGDGYGVKGRVKALGLSIVDESTSRVCMSVIHPFIHQEASCQAMHHSYAPRFKSHVPEHR